MFELLLPSIMTLKSHINICTPLQPFPCKQRMGTMEPPSWKSLRKRKHDDWSFAEVQACAAGMKDELPSQLRQIVEDPQYVGGTLIALINPPKVTWRDVKTECSSSLWSNGSNTAAQLPCCAPTSCLLCIACSTASSSISPITSRTA